MKRTDDLSDAIARFNKEIAERKSLELQLVEAKKLASLGLLAGGFAHEVRNPLSIIAAAAEAISVEDEIASNPALVVLIDHIRGQTERMRHLMNDFLDMGLTTADAEIQPVPLYEVCRETINLWKFTGTVKNRQAQLVSDNCDVADMVLADDFKLQQVLFNLLENAGNHSPDGSKIMVRLTHKDTDLAEGMEVMQVIDQGSGIAEDKLQHVFDPFYSTRKGGTGLGLALVRHFIENMGGIVHIWNNNPPPGCTVEVCVPLYQAGARSPGSRG